MGDDDSEAEMLGLERRDSDDDRDQIRKKKSKKLKDAAYDPQKSSSKLRGPRSKRKDKKTLAEEERNKDAKKALLDSDSDSDVTDADSEGDGESILKNRRRKSKSKWTQEQQLDAKCLTSIKNLSQTMNDKLNEDGYLDLFEFPELTKLKRRKGFSTRKKSSLLPLESDDDDSDEEFARLMKFKVPKPAPKSRKKKPVPITDEDEDEDNDKEDK